MRSASGQRRAVAVELRLRRVVRGHQRPRAVEGLLRQREFRLGAIDLRLALGDGLRPEPRLDTREFGLGHAQIRVALPLLRQQFGIVDADQRRALRHVLGTRHDDLPDPPVDARRHVEGARLHLALDHQRLPPGQVPDRKPDHRHEQHGDDQQRPAAGRRRSADLGDRRWRSHTCDICGIRSARSEKDVIERRPDSGGPGGDRCDRLVQRLDRLGRAS